MSAYKDPIDASHYAECSTYLLKFRRNHKFRLIATIVLLIFNFYFQTVFFVTQYSGSSSIRGVMINNDGLHVDLVSGLLTLVYMALFIGIGVILIKKGVSGRVQMLYWGIHLAVMTVFTIVGNHRTSHIPREGQAPHQLPFAYGILALFFTIACVALAFLGEQKRPKLHAALIIVTFLGGLTTCYNWLVTAVLLLMYLIAIPEFQKMQWIMQQPGYPYFNERFDEAQLHSEYEPLHKMDHRSYGEMEDLDGNAADAAVIERQEAAHKAEAIRIAAPAMDYTLKQSDDPAEMPGIEDIFEHVEPQPDPEPPLNADIPDTKWDVPDVNADIPDTKWDVPDVNTDIPDLPEIPDIPQL